MAHGKASTYGRGCRCEECKIAHRSYRSTSRYKKRVNTYQNKCNVKQNISNREFIHKIKDVPCLDCGIKFPPVCMDFDHIPERGPKRKCVGNCTLRSIKFIQEEIAKCEIVCANCHRIRTYNRRINK